MVRMFSFYCNISNVFDNNYKDLSKLVVVATAVHNDDIFYNFLDDIVARGGRSMFIN